MRRLIRTVLRILDGSPGALGNKSRGQSLVELAFITPLLAIMIIGTVEIGWYANHVLILLEVTRVGARAGTVLTGELAPARWPEDASIHPIAYVLDRGYTFTSPPISRTYNGTTVPDYAFKVAEAGVDDPPPYDIYTNEVPVPVNALLYRKCEGQDAKTGFYNFIVCAMLDSMDPIMLMGRGPTSQMPSAKGIEKSSRYATGSVAWLYPDDVVVSVFSLQAMNNDLPTEWDDAGDNKSVYPRTYNFEKNETIGLYKKGFRARVVGRYPATANECNVTFTPSGAVGSAGYMYPGEYAIERILLPLAQYGEYRRSGRIESDVVGGLPTGTFGLLPGIKQLYGVRDPFDYILDTNPASNPTTVIIGTTTRQYELDGYDNNPEFQRGFVWTGQHIIKETLPDGRQLFCIGSEWTDMEVENLMNAPNFLTKDLKFPGEPGFDAVAYENWQKQAQFLPSQGLVLVELFWNHEILINYPFLQPIMMMFGDSQRIEIAVWAVFPVPSAEPNIVFDLLPE